MDNLIALLRFCTRLFQTPITFYPFTFTLLDVLLFCAAGGLAITFFKKILN